jgi:hypothetical protein
MAGVIAQVRVSTRDGTSFRRGGLRFGAEPVPLVAGDVDPDAVIAIVADDRLKIEISEDGESWAELSGEERAMAGEQLDELFVDPEAKAKADPAAADKAATDKTPGRTGKPAKVQGA